MAVTQDPHHAVQASSQYCAKILLWFENIDLVISFFISVILVPLAHPEVSKQGVDFKFCVLTWRYMKART